MKSALIATICLVLLVVVIAQRSPRPPRTGGTGSPPTRRPRPQRCDSNEDCEEGSCCVSGPLFIRGTCSKLGGEGRKCTAEPTQRNGKYLLQCPCAEGLSCVAKKIKTTVLGEEIRIRERCTSSTAPPEIDDTDATEASSGSE